MLGAPQKDIARQLMRVARALRRSRRPRPDARGLNRARVRRPRGEQPAAGGDDFCRCARPGLHRHQVDVRNHVPMDLAHAVNTIV